MDHILLIHSSRGGYLVSAFSLLSLRVIGSQEGALIVGLRGPCGNAKEGSSDGGLWGSCPSPM